MIEEQHKLLWPQAPGWYYGIHKGITIAASIAKPKEMAEPRETKLLNTQTKVIVFAE